MPAAYTKLFLKALCYVLFWGSLSWLFIQFWLAHYWMWLLILISLWLCFTQLRKALRTLSQGVYQGQLQRKAKKPSGNHGDASFSNINEAIEAGLANLNEGAPFAELDGQLLTHASTFGLYSWATGEGKTTSVSLDTIAHGYRVPVGNGASYAAPMIIIDPKPELIAMAIVLIKELHGHNVIVLNPGKRGSYDNVSINLLKVILEDCIYAERNQFALSDASEFALALINEPDGGLDRNFYFRQGGRNILIVVILYLGCEHPDLCFMPEVFKIISNAERLLLTLNKAVTSDALSGDLANLASSILDSDDTQFAQFLSNAQQAVFPFSPSSDIGQSTSKDEFSFDDMRNPEKPTTVFIIPDLTRKKAYTQWTDSVFFNVTKILMRENKNEPVLLLAEEASNFSLRSIAENITTLRSSGLVGIFILQTISELQRMLGDTLAETMLTQSAFKSFAGVNTYKQAKEISDMIGDFTSKGYSFNPQGSAKGADLSESISEHSRPLFTPQDVLQLPKDEQIVLIQGMKPFKCKKLPYNHVDTWWHFLDNNPIEGGKLPLRRRFSVSYKDVGS